MQDGEIFHRFLEVESHSMDMQATARKILSAIDELKDQVAKTSGTEWTGEAQGAFDGLHAKWNATSTSLNETLKQIGVAVQEGNAAMRTQDGSNASMLGA
ncbi:WXG100 family type VII secretion target [Nocardia sp. NPDC052566]|uniref:WXG100 family type VII secretion target n=1 Tax=Nocardia sp. NPDC052566 TaxID=3364330 RepID=UPI0037C856FB